MNVVSIPLDLIDAGDRLREVSEDYAQMIATSMAADGQRTPIEVRTLNEAGKHRLIAGAHRLRALQMAGLAMATAVVLDVSDLEAERLQIEENLCRHELTALDRASFLARWKEIYEELYPHTRQGGKRSKRSSGQNGDLMRSIFAQDEERKARFSAAALQKFDCSERSITRAVRRYKLLAPDVRKLIAGTWLADNGSELDLLAQMQPDVQRRIVTLMGERGATSIRGIQAEISGRRQPLPDPDQAQCDALLKLWRRTGTTAKRAFAAELAKDGPWTLEEEA